jgi:hypothetical protein
MDRSIKTLLWCVGFTLMGLIVVVLPLFIFLWIAATYRFAVSHTIEFGLAFGVGYACYQMVKSKPTTGDQRTIGIFAIVGFVLIGGYAWYANNHRIELENAQAQVMANQMKAEEATVAAISKTDPETQRNSYCMSIGVAYGRGAARSMRGLTVDPKDDIEIPSECRDLPSTNRGIQRGMRQ